jgi:telomerase reverse transcriptase
MPTGPKTRRRTRVTLTDSFKRRELLEDFIYWYFDSFLLPALKVFFMSNEPTAFADLPFCLETTFYVTDSSAFRNQVMYFRQDDWETLCRPLLDRLTTTTFERLPQVFLAVVFAEILGLKLMVEIDGRARASPAA